MDNERIRELCMALPYVTETVNWGHHLVYWVGDRAAGGKMFAMTDLDGTGTGVLWFHCGAERFHELVEVEGIVPAPYLARAHWVTVESWEVLRPRQYEEELRRAHTLISAKLSQRTRKALDICKTGCAQSIGDSRKGPVSMGGTAAWAKKSDQGGRRNR
jgi:predicted DNA-binding protein (MmcQ/YjbR family)